MPNYVWVPESDAEIDQFAYQISGGGGIQGRVIRRAIDNGPEGCQRYGAWGDIAQGDTLYIPAHGRAKSTLEIGWQTAAGVVMWDSETLASALASRLSAAQKAVAIRYELLVCWSADSHWFKDPFGYRLATSLGRRGFHGTVVGYKGAIKMYGGGPTLLVAGFGRITSWFASNLSVLQIHRLFENRGKDGDDLYIDKFNYYDFSKQRKTWNIP